MGFTKDLKQRFDQLKLIYYEACLEQDDATRREKYLKTYKGRMFIKRRLKSYFTG